MLGLGGEVDTPDRECHCVEGGGRQSLVKAPVLIHGSWFMGERDIAPVPCPCLCEVRGQVGRGRWGHVDVLVLVLVARGGGRRLASASASAAWVGPVGASLLRGVGRGEPLAVSACACSIAETVNRNDSDDSF